MCRGRKQEPEFHAARAEPAYLGMYILVHYKMEELPWRKRRARKGAMCVGELVWRARRWDRSSSAGLGLGQ
jgi:hypothetical protein